MKISKLEKMYRGWFVGNFEPCAFKTSSFEVGILKHLKGEIWPKHYHKVATEINCLISGKMIVQDKELIAGDIFIFDPMEIADPVFLEDCIIVVIKTSSLKGDKYEV
jgi:quercetin dioxygenase-like cupin family protein